MFLVFLAQTYLISCYLCDAFLVVVIVAIVVYVEQDSTLIAISTMLVSESLFSPKKCIVVVS